MENKKINDVARKVLSTKNSVVSLSCPYPVPDRKPIRQRK